MDNVNITKEGENVLVIRIDTSKRYGLSQSGDSEKVATTGAPQSLADQGFPGLKLGLTLFRPLSKEEKAAARK